MASNIRVQRLSTEDIALARATFAVMCEVFEDDQPQLSDAYLTRLLARPVFWALAAFDGDRIVGGLTAHALDMTREEATELFIYDLAVHPEFQRRGIGRQLVETLRTEGSRAGLDTVFVAADNPDTHALDFYRALGGEPAPVTVFTFG